MGKKSLRWWVRHRFKYIDFLAHFMTGASIGAGKYMQAGIIFFVSAVISASLEVYVGDRSHG